MRHTFSIFVWAPFMGVVAVPVPAEEIRDISAKELKALLQKADDWDVPQPSPNAKLLKVWAFRRGGEQDIFALGFNEEENANYALVGFDHWEFGNGIETQVVEDPERVSLDDVTPVSPFSEAHGVNFGLVTGIQLLRAGNEKTGRALIRKSNGEEAGHPRSAFRSPAGESAVLTLARACLADALNQITSKKPDFEKIKRRIEMLLREQPEIQSKATDWVMKGLAASVDHKPSPAGSPGVIIDAYLLSGAIIDGLIMDAEEFSESERVVILKGFEMGLALK